MKFRKTIRDKPPKERKLPLLRFDTTQRLNTLVLEFNFTQFVLYNFRQANKTFSNLTDFFFSLNRFIKLKKIADSNLNTSYGKYLIDLISKSL